MNSLGESLVQALSGQCLGQYRLDSCLGAGGFGLVFRADHVTTNAEVAVKVLVPSSNARAAVEFDTEGTLLRKLHKCDRVITLIESGTDSVPMAAPNGQSVPFEFKYHVLSRASGSLNELTSDPEALTAWAWPDRISLWRGAVKGVHQMHLKSVAHRDIKAENCLLMVTGNRTEVRIADLGRSKDYSLGSTLPAETYLQGMGDRRFAPPEFIWLQGGHAAIDHRAADIYGLGSIFTELVTGHPMTALAIGSLQAAIREGEKDFLAGTRRDLTILRPQFVRAVGEVGDQLPRSIRHDATMLLSQLCDPVPMSRFPKRRLNSRNDPGQGLEWLIRKVDILSKRLIVEQKQAARTARSERSIS